MNDNDIIINSKELNEYLPIRQFTTNVWWSCDIDQTTGTLQIKRRFRLLPPLIWAIETIAVFILGCALLFLKPTRAEYSDIWLLGISLMFLSFFFMLVFPTILLYLISQDKYQWSECRFKCTQNGDINIFEKICFKRDKYLEAAVGVIGGHNTLALFDLSGGQKNRSKRKIKFLQNRTSNYYYQLYIYIKQDFVWKKYLLANECSKRRIMSAAKMLSKILQCKMYVRYFSYTECFDQRDMIDREVLKSISNQPYRYVGEFIPCACPESLYEDENCSTKMKFGIIFKKRHKN